MKAQIRQSLHEQLKATRIVGATPETTTLMTLKKWRWEGLIPVMVKELNGNYELVVLEQPYKGTTGVKIQSVYLLTQVQYEQAQKLCASYHELIELYQKKVELLKQHFLAVLTQKIMTDDHGEKEGENPVSGE